MFHIKPNKTTPTQKLVWHSADQNTSEKPLSKYDTHRYFHDFEGFGI